MSLIMRVGGAVVSRFPSSLKHIHPEDPLHGRLATDARLPAAMRRRYQVTEETREGHAVTTLAPSAQSSPCTIVYIHGGAYVNALMRPHWWIIDQLIRRTGATIVVPSYPLTPEHTAAEGYAWMESLLQREVDRRPDHPLVLAGDSAGGGFSAGLSLRSPQTNPAIAGIILFSPWLDVTMTNPEIPALEEHDVILGTDALRYWGTQWAGTWPGNDPRVSPIYGDLSLLPPTVIYQGHRDVFLADARKFAALATVAGADVTLHEYRDAFHVYMGLTIAPESRETFADVARHIKLWIR